MDVTILDALLTVYFSMKYWEAGDIDIEDDLIMWSVVSYGQLIYFLRAFISSWVNNKATKKLYYVRKKLVKKTYNHLLLEQITP